jgi:hypothetical protein
MQNHKSTLPPTWYHIYALEKKDFIDVVSSSASLGLVYVKEATDFAGDAAVGAMTKGADVVFSAPKFALEVAFDPQGKFEELSDGLSRAAGDAFNRAAKGGGDSRTVDKAADESITSTAPNPNRFWHGKVLISLAMHVPKQLTDPGHVIHQLSLTRTPKGSLGLSEAKDLEESKEMRALQDYKKLIKVPCGTLAGLGSPMHTSA